LALASDDLAMDNFLFWYALPIVFAQSEKWF